MAKKDVEQYYDQVCEEYKELLDSLKEMEELQAQNIVNPDQIENLKQMIEPLKNNYMTLSWIMFLLNQPNKKSKKVRYNKSLENKMNSIDPNKIRTPEAIHKENQEILNLVTTSISHD